MKENSNQSKLNTFIHGNMSESHLTHMNKIGFSYSQSQDSFRAEKYYGHITARSDLLDSNGKLPMHSHTFMEIFQYLSNNKIEYLIGTHRYIVQQGDIVCIPPGICHQVLRYTPEDAPCRRNILVISPTFLRHIGWNNLIEEGYILRIADKGSYVTELIDKCIFEYDQQLAYWQNALSGYTSILLTYLLRNTNFTIKKEQDSLFEKILTYTDDHLSEKITLEKVSQHFFVSESTITREFQRNISTSFYKYVMSRRLLEAQHLISSGIPINEVCTHVGFQDYSCFYRAFKKEFGVSPQQVKQLSHITDEE